MVLLVVYREFEETVEFYMCNEGFFRLGLVVIDEGWVITA